MVRLNSLLLSVTSLLALGALATPGASCKNDVCPYGKPDRCPKPYNCGTFCTDLKTDIQNCGKCSKKCGYGETCEKGKCKKAGPVCGYGETKCPKNSAPGGYVCRNLQENLGNCGKCGRGCGHGETCEKGKCKKAGPVCGYGETKCPKNSAPGGYVCRNLQENLGNCGKCGRGCGYGETCEKGKCKNAGPVCGYNESKCPKKSAPGGYVCRNTQKDVMNCGSCGHGCTGYGAKCQNGKCQVPAPSCPYGQTVCPKKSDPKGYVCRDLTSDDRSCGSCGKTCGYGQKCVNKQCKAPEPTCPYGKSPCGYSGCKDFQSDPVNCGGCSRKCGDKEVCKNGKCEPTCVKSGEKCKNPVSKNPVIIKALNSGTSAPKNECCNPDEQCNPDKLDPTKGTCGPKPEEPTCVESGGKCNNPVSQTPVSRGSRRLTTTPAPENECCNPNEQCNADKLNPTKGTCGPKPTEPTCVESGQQCNNPVSQTPVSRLLTTTPAPENECCNQDEQCNADKLNPTKGTCGPRPEPEPETCVVGPKRCMPILSMKLSKRLDRVIIEDPTEFEDCCESEFCEPDDAGALAGTCRPIDEQDPNEPVVCTELNTKMRGDTCIPDADCCANGDQCLANPDSMLGGSTCQAPGTPVEDDQTPS